MKKIYLILSLMFFAALNSFSQTTGDYRTAADANWSVLSTWERWNGASWVTPTVGQGYPGEFAVPAVVTILNTDDVTLDVSPANNIGSLVLQTGSSTSSITFSGTNSLTVNGNVSFEVPTDATSAKTIAVAAGSFTCGSISMDNVGGGNDDIILSISTGTVTVTGNITMSGSTSENFINITGAGTLNIGGSISLTTGTLAPGAANSTINYNGSGNQTIRDVTYETLFVSTGGTKTSNAGFTINDALTINTGATFNPAGFVHTILGGATLTVNGTLDFSNASGEIRSGTSGTTTLTMGAGGLIKTIDVNGLGPASSASFSTQAGGAWNTSSISTNGTIEYARTSAQPITDRDYNNLTLSVTAGTKTWTLTADRTVNGDLIISADVPFTLAGAFALNLKGDWIKNSTGTFTPGTTTINFNGTAAQSIDGSQSTTFNNVTFNNSLAGAAITVVKGATITGVATFTDGIVSTDATNYLTFNSGSSVSSSPSPSDGSHVDGPVRKLGVLPATFRFPTGDAGQYEFIEISSGTGTNDFTAQYIRTSATAIDADVTSPVKNVSNCDHWTLTQNTGSNTINVLLSWSDQFPCGGTTPFVTNPATLTVAHYNGASWDEAGTSGAFSGSATSGTVTRNAVSVFSPFSLGNTTLGDNPLPVKLSSIKAFEKQQGVQIDWTAYQEENLSRYTVERSANGSTFISIGEVAARNSASETSYGFFDANPLSGISFYRLKSIDIDNKFAYSSIVKVNLDKNVKDISLYPNPATGGYISFQGADLAKGSYTVKVYNSTGIQVMSQNFNHTGGAITQTLKLPTGISSGMYSLQLVNEGVKVMSKTFMVQ